MAEHEEHEKRARGGKLEMRDMDEPINEERGGKIRRPRRAKGGKTHPVNEYNAKGSPEMKEAEDEREEFKKGGHEKRKAGGHAMGEHAEHRADKEPRGRRAKGGATHHHEVEHHKGHTATHHGEGDIHMKRGGEHHKRAAGGSVWSSGSKLRPPADGDRGHEGQKVPEEPD